MSSCESRRRTKGLNVNHLKQQVTLNQKGGFLLPKDWKPPNERYKIEEDGTKKFLRTNCAAFLEQGQQKVWLRWYPFKQQFPYTWNNCPAEGNIFNRCKSYIGQTEQSLILLEEI